MKDPQRNGGRNLELLHEHVANDDSPGAGIRGLGAIRSPAPNSKQWVN
jgi:hypothetical protein